MNADCFLPHFKRPISTLCLSTPALGGSEELKNGEDRPNRIYGTNTCGEAIPNGTSVEYRFASPTSLKSVHVVFDSDLNRDSLPGCLNERMHVTRANVMLSSPQTCMPKTLCKSFRIVAQTEMGEKTLLSVKENILRSYHCPISEPVSAIRLEMNENWGGTDLTNLLSFDFQ